MGDENHRTSKKRFTFKLSQLFNAEPQNRKELIELIRDAEENHLIDPDTLGMIEGVMDIAELRVRDIMIPRTQIVAIKDSFNLDECLDLIFENGHSRYPVISEDHDHIEGILMAKDLLMVMKQGRETFDLKKLLRAPVVIPEGKRVDQMLKEFRQQRFHMAIAIDEFGGVSGLVTIEDILELIVGDIEDEYDEVEDVDVRQINATTYSVRALTPIEDFNEAFTTQFSDDEVDTIGGLVMQQFGRLPIKGETIKIQDYQFKVTSVDKRRIIQLHVTLPENAPQPILS
ncbi:CNNM family magnesium/cobalt transport protein CorC [Orbaceae bacterium ac157xtp]